MGNLSAHFDSKEFRCKCGCALSAPHPSLIDGLEALRLLVGKPVIVTCGSRCKAHNDALHRADPIGVAEFSYHLPQHDGLTWAADVRVAGMTMLELRRHALNVPIFNRGGIGLYGSWVHVDVRNGTARWGSAPKVA